MKARWRLVVRRDNITAARAILGDKYLDASGQRRFAYKRAAEEAAEALAAMGVTVTVVPDGKGGSVVAKNITAVLVFHHDDPPCNARLTPEGFCRECGIHPDMQSTCIYYYCPTCDCRLIEWRCPKCGSDVQPPVGYKGR